MNLRMDTDNVVYIDDPANNDLFVVIPLIGGKYSVESRRFGNIRYFDSQLMACNYCRECLKK